MSYCKLRVLCIWVICDFLVNSQSLPHLEHEEHSLSNNSFIYYPDIGDVAMALKCVTNRGSCCSESNTGNWTDERERQVHQGADGDTCLYVTRGNGEINLNRKSYCTDHTPGLWRCDIPDSSGEMQSLYIYISNRRSHGELYYFILCYFLLH